MALAIGIWSLELVPGKEEIVQPPADIRITNIALGDVLKDTSGRSTVKFTFEPSGHVDSEDEDEAAPGPVTTVLCSLKPDTFEQTSTDLILQEDETYKFTLVGKNTVYLTGNYIDQSVNNPPFDDMDSDMDSEEDAYDLREVSSDVEMHPDDLESDASRFEEVVDAPRSLKRPRESDADEEAAKPSKAEKKKKKQKSEAASEQKKAESKKENEEGASKEKGSTSQEKESAAKEKDGASKAKSVEREIAGGIKIYDAKIGTGPMAKKGNTVRMRYIGKLTNGKVFDKNTKGKPFTFHLGKGEVIKGWDEGIVGMQVGGERRLTIPPAMAYGKNGTDGIPKNATLIFEVKLMEIK
ncbi:putative peptidylprolyl isomerase [Lyophyllum shimeji]|uniref:peptidylprolyl isomerase n=1 Tax=Lyophyllum shimeji TaxID=47721 RepID=A0A9P3PLB4_LYOSH|nr:putative peptidylprolyl isomerase [Lyophyllum shimeji]